MITPKIAPDPTPQSPSPIPHPPSFSQIFTRTLQIWRSSRPPLPQKCPRFKQTVSPTTTHQHPKLATSPLKLLLTTQWYRASLFRPAVSNQHHRPKTFECKLSAPNDEDTVGKTPYYDGNRAWHFQSVEEKNLRQHQTFNSLQQSPSNLVRGKGYKNLPAGHFFSKPHPSLMSLHILLIRGSFWMY